jgi:3-deoxy-D-manno-octulosonate 8-phosphate phosphatase (KDO 8-P phosphatase)
MNQDLLQRGKAIKLAVFDVDGVLTDGRLYFLEDGSEFKTFNTLDGQGIKMLMAAGVQTAIISGRKTPVVERRAKNLGIPHLFQGREDKLVVLDGLLAELNLSYEQVAYLGDDLPDLPVIRRVGLGMAVANAAPSFANTPMASPGPRRRRCRPRVLRIDPARPGPLDAANAAYL